MGAVWEGWFTVVVVVGAFVCLLWDVVQPDHVMVGALTILMAAGVVSVEEGLAGFSNEGLLTVATLFVVAAGISATGGLDWYMSKLLGKPRTIAGAQVRLMVPIALVSGFLNNTPVVAVMIPIVQRWAENIHIPKEQVMIPLSFASILGGTCTLIGTSTNLVVLGMLQQWRGTDGTSAETHAMGLFDLGLVFGGEGSAEAGFLVDLFLRFERRQGLNALGLRRLLRRGLRLGLGGGGFFRRGAFEARVLPGLDRLVGLAAVFAADQLADVALSISLGNVVVERVFRRRALQLDGIVGQVWVGLRKDNKLGHGSTRSTCLTPPRLPRFRCPVWAVPGTRFFCGSIVAQMWRKRASNVARLISAPFQPQFWKH